MEREGEQWEGMGGDEVGEGVGGGGGEWSGVGGDGGGWSGVGGSGGGWGGGGGGLRLGVLEEGSEVHEAAVPVPLIDVLVQHL